jgi:hypothetical protein
MKYMLLCYDNEEAWAQLGANAQRAAMGQAADLCRDLDAKGQYILAAPLHPVATATSVRVRSGQTLVTDGPFAETREQLGGFYLIKASGIEEAIGIASRHPGALLGAVEVRPILEITGLPES